MTTTIDGNSGIIFPNSTTQASAGQVLQVVQGSYSTIVNSTSTSFVDTGLSATITPKFATSKILAMVVQSVYWYDITAPQDAGLVFQLLRNSTTVFTQSPQKDALYFYSPTGTSRFDFGFAYPINYLDSPLSTSALTYKIQGAGLNSDSRMIFQEASQYSTITLMEIAA